MMEYLQRPYFLIPALVRGFLGTWVIMIFLLGTVILVISLKQRQRGVFAASLLPFLGSVFLMHAVRTVSQTLQEHDPSIKGEMPIYGMARLTLSASSASFLAWLCALIIMTVIAGVLFAAIAKKKKNHVSPTSIQESFEKLTEGLCYYREGGQCVLVNERMHELCREYTGHVLLNGEEFEKRIFLDEQGAVVRENDGRAFLFSRRKVPFDKETLTEIIAADVTELYQRTIELQEETRRLQEFQEELTQYHRDLQENVRREEILRAKMSIHDEMNRLLLTTKNAASAGSEEERKRVLAAWKNNALLLCKETESATEMEEVLRDLAVIADSLGIQLVLDARPDNLGEDALRFCVLVLREAMNNAVKHANAKHLYIRSSMEAGTLRLEVTNDGVPPTGEILEAGGLRNLREKLEAAGGELRLTSSDRFLLEAVIPAQ